MQLANLHGDIIATAYLSEAATELESKSDTSEFGVPTNGLPPKYSWLGAIEVQTTELPSGVISMGARSYVPQLGRFLQPDPIPGGSANAYSYTFGDPVNSSDPSGEYTWGFSASLFAQLDRAAQEVAEREEAREAAERRVAEEAAARQAAEQAALQAALAAESAAGPQYIQEWEESWEEEEGEYEYASYKHAGSSEEQPHVEPAVLYTPLGGGNEDDSFEDEWRRIFIVGSRCEQYGGHWKGHRCVGIPSHHGGINITCGDIGGAIGGAVGGAVGGALTGGAGAVAGGAAGGYAGNRAGEALCH